MELKRPVARPEPTQQGTTLYKPKPKAISIVEQEPTTATLINSVDDAIEFFINKIGLAKELLLILINTRYGAQTYNDFQRLDKLDLLAQLTQVNSVAELSKRLSEVPPIDWSKKKK